jgi:hypothetical protein
MDFIDINGHPVMREVAAGRAYSGRWDRKKAMLAELRGEELPEDDEPTQQPPAPDRPTVAPVGSATERLLLRTGFTLERSAAQAEAAAPAKTSTSPVRDEAEIAAALLSEEHWELDGTPGERLGAKKTAREWIKLVLRDARPDTLTAAQVHARIVEQGVDVSYARVHDLLKTMAGKGDEVRQNGNGYELVSGR